MRLASVHTYPVKGCHRVDHDGAAVRVEPWGLAGDRRWLVVDPDGRCVTQRETAALVRVRPAVRPDGDLVLRADGAPELVVPQPTGDPAGNPARGPAGDVARVEVDVHRSTIAATPAGDAADRWLTRVLDRPVRLVWLDDPTRRPVDPAYARPADRVSFADAYPLLLTNAASLEAVNGWLREAADGDTASGDADGGDADGGEGPLPMTRFRPNLVVAGAGAWAEDGWLGHRLRVGAVTFRVAKPCDRCVVTTTDQETGVRGREPLRTLGRYRNVDQKLLFGMNLIPDPPYGTVTAGDPVTLAAED